MRDLALIIESTTGFLLIYLAYCLLSRKKSPKGSARQLFLDGTFGLSKVGYEVQKLAAKLRLIA